MKYLTFNRPLGHVIAIVLFWAWSAIFLGVSALLMGLSIRFDNAAWYMVWGMRVVSISVPLLGIPTARLIAELCLLAFRLYELANNINGNVYAIAAMQKEEVMRLRSSLSNYSHSRSRN